jgi:putative FmdB family regulatory protein
MRARPYNRVAMPTYEYACTSCGNRFEIFQRIDDEPLTVCDACGGALRKVFHPAGIVFKGSGFYATDSRSKKVKEGATASGDGSGDGKKSEPSSRSKEPASSGSKDSAKDSSKDSSKEKTA